MSDLVVIGGGVVGLSVAFEARRAGLAVRVLDERREGAATAASGGMLTPSLEVEEAPPALVATMVDSCARYPAFAEAVGQASGLDPGFSTGGTVFVARDRDHRAELLHLQRRQEAAGVRCETLTAAEVRALEPALHPRVVGGLFAPDEHRVDPRALSVALEAAVVALGGRVERTRVLDLQRERGRLIAVRTEAETIAAERAVVAAGAWSGRLVPLLAAACRPVRGQVVRLRGAGLLTRTVRSPDVYLVPRDDGGLLVGATAEELGFDASPRAGAVLDLLRHAWAVLPGVAELTFEDTAIGFRPALIDPAPAIGPTDIDGLWVATGHHRHGMTLAPWTAAHVVEGLTGEVPAALAPFDPRRLSRRATAAGK